MTTAIKIGVQVDRRTLVSALQKIVSVIPRASTKPVLQCVKIEANNGLVWLAASNLETSLVLTLPVNGELPQSVVPARDLLQRIKASKSPDCELWIEDDCLGVNGGTVEHRLPLMDLKEFPPVPMQSKGKAIVLPGDEFRQAATVALTGVARENTRYAINGVLLEVEGGARLVATDGRRLVVCELGMPTEAGMSAILPSLMCQMVRKLIDKDDRNPVRIYIDEHTEADGKRGRSDLYVVGPGWVLHSMEVEGRFPAWRDVVPKGGSRFMLDRGELLAAVQEVSLSCISHGRGVHLRLASPGSTVSVETEGRESSGQVETKFLGGGDGVVVTGFNPEFLADALHTVDGPKVVFELKQNTLATSGKVSHHPPVISGFNSRRVQWVVMPVSTGVEPSRETLGSNFKDKEKVA